MSRCMRMRVCTYVCTVRMWVCWWGVSGAPKKDALKNLANFSRTIKSYDIKFYYWLLIQLSINVEVSLHYPHNWQSIVMATSWDVIKNCLNYSRRRKCRNRKCEHFLSTDKCLECLPSPFTYSYRTTGKTRDSFINWTGGKLSHYILQCDF